MKFSPSLLTYLLGYKTEHKVHILRHYGVERDRNPQLPRAPIKLAWAEPRKENFPVLSSAYTMVFEEYLFGSLPCMPR